MLKPRPRSSSLKVIASFWFFITALAASGFVTIVFFLLGLGLQVRALMVLSFFIGVAIALMRRRYRWLSWVIVPGFILAMAGLWIASSWSLRVYHGAPYRVFRLDDYELARQFRKQDAWNSKRAFGAFVRVDALQREHPDRYPEFAIAEMQLLRQILPQAFIHSPGWQRFLQQRAQRSWQRDIQPAVESTWQDIQYVCSGKPRWYAVPFLALSCFHEARDLAWISKLLTEPEEKKPYPYPEFLPHIWDQVKTHLYRYEQSPVLNEIVTRESLMFYRIARKLHMWRRIALLVAMNFKDTVPPDPFAEDGTSFEVRGCRIITKANFIYNWCHGEGERPELDLQREH